MRGVPGEHRREHRQADRDRQVRPRPAADQRRAEGSSSEVEQRPDRQEDRVVLAQQRPAPGQADAQPAAEPLRAPRAPTASRSSVRSQKNRSGPSGRANAPAAAV